MPLYVPVNPDTRLMTKRLLESPIYIQAATVKAVQITADGLRNNQYASLDVRRTEKGNYVVDVYIMSEIDGKRTAILESSQSVRAGDWIITNPIQHLGDRESHCCKSDQAFREDFGPTSKTGVYHNKGSMLRAVKNPAGTSIEIPTPDGGTQYGDHECYLCTPVDCRDLSNDGVGKRWLISAQDFHATYAPIEEVLGTDWRDKL